MTAKRKSIDSKRTKNHNQKIVEPNTYLETQKPHKKWYDIREMGKQRGRPRLVPREQKKAGGTTRHSLRKEK